MNAEKGNPFASAAIREEKLNLRINLPWFWRIIKKVPRVYPWGAIELF